MATITKGKTFISGETVEPNDMHQLVDNATIAFTTANDTDDSTLEVSGNKFRVKDDGITANKLDGVLDLATKTADYTLVLADAGRVIDVNSSSNLTVTVPDNATAAFATGAQVVITRRGTGDVTIAGAGGVTLRSADSRAKIGKQYAAVAVIKIGTDEWLLVGNLKA